MKEKLKEYRNRIEAISHDIVALVEKRAYVAHIIAKVKKEHSLAVIDEDREQALLTRLQAGTTLPKTMVKDLFEVIIKHSRNIQQ